MRPIVRRAVALSMLAAAGLALALAAEPALAAGADAGADLPWWVWPLSLFFVCFALGIVAVPAGVGGGVLFVPIVSGFFPFHLDFVRGTGLLVALASALSAGPSLLRAGLADLRLALPLALLASASSIAGALIGLAMSAQVVQVALGVTILGIVALMASAPKSESGASVTPDRLAAALAIHGVYHDRATGRNHPWNVHRTPLALVLFDLDHFKKLNDTFGHLAGDHVLETLAKLVTRTMRKEDFFARWGGEEFAVVLPRTRREDGVKVVERILAELRGLKLGESEDPIGCTASIGVAMSAGGAERFERLIDRADQAMYRAKLAGKDRWEAAPPPS